MPSTAEDRDGAPIDGNRQRDLVGIEDGDGLRHGRAIGASDRPRLRFLALPRLKPHKESRMHYSRTLAGSFLVLAFSGGDADLKERACEGACVSSLIADYPRKAIHEIVT